MSSSEAPVAVTGATGFLGRALVDQLVSAGSSVRALTRRPQPATRHVEWIEGDLDDAEALRQLCTGAKTVFHLAALTKARSREIFMAVNATAAARLAELAREAGARRFVLVSSLAAREPHLSPYAASKAAAEAAVKEAAGDMDIAIVRPPAIIGPNDTATAQLLDGLKAGWLPVPGGRSSSTIAIMYVDDIARFILQLGDGEPPDSVVEPMSPPGGVTWRGLADTATEVLSKRVRLVPVPAPLLLTAAYVAEGVSGLFGKTSYFNAGKVRELLHPDWRGKTVMAGARDLSETLRLALNLKAVE